MSHRYYFNNVPFLGLWGLKYLTSTSLFSEFLSAASSRNLPSVSFVDPRFTELDDGLGNDDHPHSDVRNGDAFLSKVFHAIATGPKWASTVLVVTFDEWGGFFDHVAPPFAVPANHIDTYLVNGQVLLGFRVPTIIASPFTRGTNQVDGTVYDHTSILKLIEWRSGLAPLTPRDSAANNPAANFNFASPALQVPALAQPGTVVGLPCFLQRVAGANAQPAVTAETAPESAFGALKNTATVQDWLSRANFKGAK